jgi:hypothetical protein
VQKGNIVAYITNAKEARAAIGKRVYWDEISPRYKMPRTGILSDVAGKNLLINNDWKWRPNLTNLRDTEDILQPNINEVTNE